jgi:tellurite resistance protein TerB
LIACSDAVLEQCETERFFEIVRTSDSLSKLPWDHIESQFERVTNDILKQGAAGREAALASVAAVKADNAHRDAVIACARIAVVSNFQVQDVEERALKEVCTALGVQPDDI